MRCFFCGSEQSSVIDKRGVKGSGEIRRRRKCLRCENRFTTYERAANLELYILKKNGARELFDREKLRAGLERALEKRPALDSIEGIVDKILKRLSLKNQREIESIKVGRVALSELKKIDKVAYLRFASVYRQFNEVGDFKKELDNLRIT